MDRFSRGYIKSFRAKLGLSQEGLARELGVSLSTVNRWESATSYPSQLARKTLLQLEDKMNNSKNELGQEERATV